MKIIGVTTCPSGVAHTYMAATALMDSAHKYGVEMKVELQSGAGIENRLSKQEIEEAVCVIIANDISIQEEERFAGKKVLKLPVADIIKKSDAIIRKIIATFSK